MKFRVQITETLQKVVEVDAANADAAQNLVEEWYGREEIVLMSEDFKYVDFEVVG